MVLSSQSSCCSIVVGDKCLLVKVRMTKTQSVKVSPVTYYLPELRGSPCCPVMAWANYANVTQAFPNAQAFLLPTGLPLALSALKRAFKLSSLAVFGSDKGLRRGGTQACQSAGIYLECIMKAGTWKSRAVNSYLNGSVVASAPTVLGRIFG